MALKNDLIIRVPIVLFSLRWLARPKPRHRSERSSKRRASTPFTWPEWRLWAGEQRRQYNSLVPGDMEGKRLDQKGRSNAQRSTLQWLNIVLVVAIILA